MEPFDYVNVNLEDLAAERSEEYASARPFPNTSLDGVFSDSLLDKVVGEFSRDIEWADAQLPKKSPKKRTAPERGAGPYTNQLLSTLKSSSFIRFVERLTGIPKLIPDLHIRSGGLHSYSTGGRLELHTDYNYSSQLRLYRRVNLLLYLNRGWKDEWGGELQLWNQDFSEESKVYPAFNRMAIAHVLPNGMHGVGGISCPENESRRSIAVWYFTAELPLELQSEYDMCEPNFIERKGDTPIALPRPLWRKLAPPIVAYYLRQRGQSFAFSPHATMLAATRFLPPILIKTMCTLARRLSGKPRMPR